MEIVVHDKNAFHHFMKEKDVAWQLYFKRCRKRYIIQFGVGILLAIVGFSTANFFVNKIEYVNNITHQNQTIYEHSSFNLVTAIGIAYIFLVSVSLYNLHRHKEISLDEASLRGKAFFKNSNESMNIFTDVDCSDETPVFKNLYKWEFFTSFSIYRNHIFLNIDKAATQVLAINKELLSNESYQELMNFIKQKLPEKKA